MAETLIPVEDPKDALHTAMGHVYDARDKVRALAVLFNSFGNTGSDVNDPEHLQGLGLILDQLGEELRGAAHIIDEASVKLGRNEFFSLTEQEYEFTLGALDALIKWERHRMDSGQIKKPDENDQLELVADVQALKGKISGYLKRGT